MGNGNTRSALRAKEYVRYLEVIKLNIEIGLNLRKKREIFIHDFYKFFIYFNRVLTIGKREEERKKSCHQLQDCNPVKRNLNRQTETIASV